MSDNPKSTFARRRRAARPRDKRHEVRDDAVPGLMLRVWPSGPAAPTAPCRCSR